MTQSSLLTFTEKGFASALPLLFPSLGGTFSHFSRESSFPFLTAGRAFRTNVLLPFLASALACSVFLGIPSFTIAAGNHRLPSVSRSLANPTRLPWWNDRELLSRGSIPSRPRISFPSDLSSTRSGRAGWISVLVPFHSSRVTSRACVRSCRITRVRR